MSTIHVPNKNYRPRKYKRLYRVGKTLVQVKQGRSLSMFNSPELEEGRLLCKQLNMYSMFTALAAKKLAFPRDPILLRWGQRRCGRCIILPEGIGSCVAFDAAISNKEKK